MSSGARCGTLQRESGMGMAGRVQKYASRKLFALEQRTPRFKAVWQFAARLLGKDVADRYEDIRHWSLLCSSLRTGSRQDKKNCWEFSRCRKEVHGQIADILSVCPVALESRLDGVHGGRNAGRACWVVPGTHCHGSVQSTPEEKRMACKHCGFYQAVKADEGADFIQREEVLRMFLE